MSLFELVLAKSGKDIGFSYPAVSNDDELEHDVVVLVPGPGPDELVEHGLLWNILECFEL